MKPNCTHAFFTKDYDIKWEPHIDNMNSGSKDIRLGNCVDTKAQIRSLT